MRDVRLCFDSLGSIPDRKRLAPAFDAAALAADLALIERGHWQPHSVSGNYRGDSSAMALRAAAGETHPIRLIYANPTATEWVDTPLMARVPAMRAAVAALCCSVQSVRLMRLGPGSAILPHEDLDLAAEQGRARLHLPIATNPGVRFVLSGEAVPMEVGELWYLRLSDTHAAVNEGASPRVHLVIDVLANDWLVAMLRG
ncbi:MULTISPECIES: aspartyl/asparaginyl beta-hydroxylase domain-containing protein [Sphingomonas]|uniref:aspartyl/asparaginyl beta-hydroxylase domain-containing protein n=1 Tax=Sphingomonas TaxID=13687 RepID=UPI000ABF76E3|nr:aspartyl/asparaginyl beta-hydroxylase domain-containing protein [Sphingomonas sp. CCH10-B3]